ncbi:hypothetical protein BC832DRAFT_583239 [Gaertneriomyces semiglobifer]|nr:hypothetical protein BC832DRAFT_583239 [Gaertneriomyces semiglobifer]
MAAMLPQNGRAIVKNVLSGDTIILRGAPRGGPPPEKVLSLSNLVAPRLGSAKDPSKEEEFAFESREFLRHLLVGKEVSYSVEYITNTNQRDFGVVVLPQAVNGETKLNRVIVSEGWARVKVLDGKRAASEEQETLTQLEDAAIAAKKGIWADSPTAPSARYDLSGDARSFLEKHKGVPINAVLEQVRDGSTYRVCLLLGNGVRQYITLLLSGIKAPTRRKGIPNVEDLVEPHSEEAKFFVESRLLQRDIKVVLEGLSTNDNLVGSVQFPAGNIAEALLAEGLAKVVDWNIALVTGGAQRYRAAEKRAKDKKLRLWKNWVGKAKVGGPEPEFDGIVTRVLSGDTIFVESTSSGKEHRLQLASIRAPKGPEKSSIANKDPSIKEYGYDFEAREFLRSRYIGKSVHVLIDYIKPAEGQYEERECATVTHGSKNLAETLVSRGLADIIRHRRDDDNRSSQYDQLLVALDKAQTAQKGIHSQKDAPLHRIGDASASAAKARQFLPFLQRSGRVSGVVDYVSSGSRFRIYVPSQSCSITLVLGGVRVPKVGRSNEKSEPYGPEALDFMSKRAMQRDVEFSVAGVDKVGGFIGSLYVPVNGEHKDAALMLLEEGYAYVHEYSANQNSSAPALYAAERNARDAVKGVWKDYKPEEKDAATEEPLQNEAKAENKDAIVSNIEGGGRLFLQIFGSELDRLEKLMSDFALHHRTETASYKPRVGEYCSGKFTVDGQWYRARVKQVNSDNTYLLVYVDYGNSETVSASHIRPLDSSFNTMALAPQAVEAKLAYISVPGLDEDYGDEAFESLRDLTEGRTLQATILGRVASVTGTGQALSVVLVDPKKRSAGSINEELVKAGLATVEKSVAKRFTASQKAGGRDAKKGVIGALIDAQDYAKKTRANMWRYGDFTADEE